MVQEREIPPRRGPRYATTTPESVQVEHHELRLFMAGEPDQEIAGVEVLMEKTSFVKASRQDGQVLGQLLADPRPLWLRPARKHAGHEFIERGRVEHSDGNQVVLE